MTTILAVLFQIPGGGVASPIGTVADINPTNGVPRDAAGADIPQPPLLVQVNALVAHATATATATATAIANAHVAPPPVTVTFARAVC
jgi:hypothetical protein